MKISRFSLTLILCLLTLHVVAQREDGRADHGDLVTFRGQILDKKTQEPIDGKVIYRTLPENDNVGIISNDKSVTGHFTLDLYDNHNYEMEVKAPGYMSFYTHIYLPNPNYQDTMHTYYLVSMKPGELVRLDRVLFDRASYEITLEAKKEIDRLYEVLQSNPDMEIQLEGHTDYHGDPELNMELSKNRVEAVKDYLEEKGISGRRIKTKGFGGEQPLSTEQSKEAIEANMRVEVRILEI